MDSHRETTEPPFFINDCRSRRTDGPIVATTFPQFVTKPRAADQGCAATRGPTADTLP